LISKILVGNHNEEKYSDNFGVGWNNIGTEVKEHIATATATAFRMLIISLQVTSTYSKLLRVPPAESVTVQ
jgi:hypothetical protein